MIFVEIQSRGDLTKYTINKY